MTRGVRHQTQYRCLVTSYHLTVRAPFLLLRHHRSRPRARANSARLRRHRLIRLRAITPDSNRLATSPAWGQGRGRNQQVTKGHRNCGRWVSNRAGLFALGEQQAVFVDSCGQGGGVSVVRLRCRRQIRRGTRHRVRAGPYEPIGNFLPHILPPLCRRSPSR